MRSHPSSALLTGVIILLVSAFCASAQPSWQLLGLKDRGINCLLADDTTMIIAGTDSGMSVYWRSTWYAFPLKDPVTSICRSSTRYIYVGTSPAKDTGGAVYIGNNIILGPPFYSLHREQPFVEPTAMANYSMDIIPRLFTGGRNVVAYSWEISLDSLQPFQPFKIPPYAFGVENPKCAALFMFGGDALYAGGYDRGLMAGPGSLLELSGAGDTLLTIRRLNVTSLAQGTFRLGPTGPQLVIGTRDTGVLLYGPASQSWYAIASPSGRLPVNHLIVVSAGALASDVIIAACDSGVYTINNPMGIWTEVGNIPATPQCIAQRGTITGTSLNGALLAGTTAGVYLYALPTAIREHLQQADFARPARPMVCRNNEVRLLLPKGIIAVDIYTASGKLCRRVAVSAQATSFRLETEGVYYYRCVAGNSTALSGVLVNMR
jgi:hypothetical protein